LAARDKRKGEVESLYTSAKSPESDGISIRDCSNRGRWDRDILKGRKRQMDGG